MRGEGQSRRGIKDRIKTTVSVLKHRFQPVYERWVAKPAFQVIIRTVNQVGNNNVPTLAGNISYNIILSLFPLLFGALAVFGYFFNTPAFQDRIITYIQQYLPSAANILGQNFSGVTRVRALLGIIGVLGLLWTGISIFSTLDDAVNRAWGVTRFRSFFPAKLREILVALICVALFLASLGMTIALDYLRKSNVVYSSALVQVGGYLVSFVFIFLMFAAIYKLFPNTRVRWPEVIPGALLAALLFELARQLFVYYAGNVVRYQLIYGSLATIIFFLIWVYYSALIIMISAIFSVQLYRIRRERREGTFRVVKFGQSP